MWSGGHLTLSRTRLCLTVAKGTTGCVLMVVLTAAWVYGGGGEITDGARRSTTARTRPGIAFTCPSVRTVLTRTRCWLRMLTCSRCLLRVHPNAFHVVNETRPEFGASKQIMQRFVG